MGLRIAKTCNRREMNCGRVPLMSVETVPRITGMQLTHLAIANDFRHDGGSRDRRAPAITMAYAALSHWQFRDAECIHEHNVRKRRQGQHRSPHGDERRLVNIDVVDFFGIGGCDCPSNRAAGDLVEQPLPLERGNHLGVGQAANPPIRVKHNGGSYHRPRQAAPPDFVHAGDMAEANAPKRVLQGPHGGYATHMGLARRAKQRASLQPALPGPPTYLDFPASFILAALPLRSRR